MLDVLVTLLVIMERIGSRYYYSWRIAKAHVGLFKMLSQPENYDTIVWDKEIKVFPIHSKQLDELDNLIRILGKCAEKVFMKIVLVCCPILKCHSNPLKVMEMKKIKIKMTANHHHYYYYYFRFNRYINNTRE